MLLDFKSKKVEIRSNFVLIYQNEDVELDEGICSPHTAIKKVG